MNNFLSTMLIEMKLAAIFIICFLYQFVWSDSLDLEPISPLILSQDLSSEGVYQLGKMLFEEKKLSKDGTISCSSCHNLETNGADTRDHSVGIGGAIGKVNAPTVFNSSLNFTLFWDGRAKSLQSQIDGPIQNSIEMGSKWEDIVKKLESDNRYKRLFNLYYADGITVQNIKTAITRFEEQLITTNARFDLYLKGDKRALNDQELLGYSRFKNLGCVACHQGYNIGGNLYQKMGIMRDYFKDRKTPLTEADYGRYNVTKLEQDKFVFRVPSLRNVAITPPYFHDGSAKTLEEAVRVMGEYQLGQTLKKEEINSIVAFLKTLTGERPVILRALAK
jgi:cytochrome c peroxidase